MFGEGIDQRAAGVAELQDGGDLVEGLADGVIVGAADAFEVVEGADVIERGMAAGDDQADGGERGCRRWRAIVRRGIVLHHTI